MTKRRLTFLLLIPTIVVVNVFFFGVVSLYYFDTYAYGTKVGVIYTVVSQLFWLVWLSDEIGLKVFRGGDWLPATTTLGNVVIWVSIVIDLIIYYLLSSTIAGLWLKYRYRKM